MSILEKSSLSVKVPLCYVINFLKLLPGKTRKDLRKLRRIGVELTKALINFLLFASKLSNCKE